MEHTMHSPLPHGAPHYPWWLPPAFKAHQPIYEKKVIRRAVESSQEKAKDPEEFYQRQAAWHKCLQERTARKRREESIKVGRIPMPPVSFP